jgi:hypothetical protein
VAFSIAFFISPAISSIGVEFRDRSSLSNALCWRVKLSVGFDSAEELAFVCKSIPESLPSNVTILNVDTLYLIFRIFIMSNRSFWSSFG